MSQTAIKPLKNESNYKTSQLEKELKALPIEKLADLQPGEYVIN